MRAAHVAAVLVVAALVGVGCDAGSLVLTSSAFGFLQEPLAAQCCACLSRASLDRATVDEPCPDLPADATVVPCLCDVDAETCTARLVDGEPITVVGRCVDPVGPCATDCDGVLAFP